MILAIGAAGMAASSALDLLSSLTSSKFASTKSAGGAQSRSLFSADGAAATPQPVAGSAVAASGRLSPATFNALLSTQGASPASAGASDALKDLFARIDGNTDGKITKAEFDNVLGAGGTNTAAADNVFGKMDANGDGAVSLDEMATALSASAPSNASSAASAKYNLVDQMVQRQSQALADAARQQPVSVKI